jgi:hypothetical protein
MVHDSRRRLLLASALVLPLGRVHASGSGAEKSAVAALTRGNCIVLVRHAETVAGIGDPPGMRLDDCSTQRNLSAAGRAQARRIGQWFRMHDLMPAQVRSSQWCRCLDTAREAFSASAFGSELPVRAWPALNSFFQGQGDRQGQLREAAEMARSIALRRSYGQFEVLVTHQVVVTALTGVSLSMGEMVVAGFKGADAGAIAPEGSLRVMASGLMP